jgi:hypothetical protein
VFIAQWYRLSFSTTSHDNCSRTAVLVIDIPRLHARNSDLHRSRGPGILVRKDVATVIPTKCLKNSDQPNEERGGGRGLSLKKGGFLTWPATTVLYLHSQNRERDGRGSIGVSLCPSHNSIRYSYFGSMLD